MQLAGLERELLEALATAEGDLLENTALIASLTKTKTKAAEIEQALAQSASASQQLDTQRGTVQLDMIISDTCIQDTAL